MSRDACVQAIRDQAQETELVKKRMEGLNSVFEAKNSALKQVSSGCRASLKSFQPKS